MPFDEQTVARDWQWPDLGPSIPLRSFPSHSTPPKSRSREISIENGPIDLCPTDDRQNCGSAQTLTVDPSTIQSHSPYLHSRESSFQGHIPLPAALRSMQRDSLQRSHSPENIERHKRRKTHTEGSIAHGHHVITHELPWQTGHVLPAEASECTFHTFSVSGESVEHGETKRRSERQLEEVNKVRRLKACLQCRRAKARVSTSL